MSHRIPTIVITSLAVLSLGLSACSSTAPATPSPADTVTPELTQSTGDATAAKPDLSSKLLVGQVAGFTLTQVQVHEDANSPFPDLENPYYDSDTQATIDPAGCEATGIEQLVVGSEGATENENVRVALGTDTSSPQKHRQYAQKCSTTTGTVNGEPISESVTLEDAPTIDGVTDVVATSASSSTPNTDETGPKSYLITGNVGDVNVVVHLFPLESGQDASYTDAVALFKTQVEKLNS